GMAVDGCQAVVDRPARTLDVAFPDQCAGTQHRDLDDVVGVFGYGDADGRRLDGSQCRVEVAGVQRDPRARGCAEPRVVSLGGEVVEGREHCCGTLEVALQAHCERALAMGWYEVSPQPVLLDELVNFVEHFYARGEVRDRHL